MTSINDLGFLSDCQSAAIVTRKGSIDWYSPNRFDAPSVFSKLLDPHGGHWSITPQNVVRVERNYVEDTLVLQTIFHTSEGVVRLTDALALGAEERGHQIGKRSPHIILRRIEGLQGEVSMCMELLVRPEYALTHPMILRQQDRILFRSGSTELSFTCDLAVDIDKTDVIAKWHIQSGETIHFALAYKDYYADDSRSEEINVTEELENTITGWQSWMQMHQSYEGVAINAVRRSALVLQGLTYQPTGAVVAAATTSLPEEIGGSSNWDYRFVWLRDLSLILHSLWIAACPDESKAFFHWVARTMGDLTQAPDAVQIVFRVDGLRDLTEHSLRHLQGYQHSRPVRVGNDAWYQKQLDVPGEVIDALYLLRDQIGEFDPILQQLVIALATFTVQHWHEPDAGMWEARDRERHYLTSKVYCWVALDRAIKLADQLGDDVPVELWKETRDEIRQTILEKGWNADVGAYTGAFGSDRLDASVLLMPLVGFLDAKDERMRATIRLIDHRLVSDNVVFRWDGDPNGFFLCNFWLVQCLARLGDLDHAQQLFEVTLSRANDLGLFAEMIDSKTGTLIGNFPQALSHVGLINAAWELTRHQNDHTGENSG